MEFLSGIYVDSLVKPGKRMNKWGIATGTAPEACEGWRNEYFTRGADLSITERPQGAW
jgi:hypothetical protein